MTKSHRGRLLFSTCLTGAALAFSSGAQAQDGEPNWRPQVEAEAGAGEAGGEVAIELFAPLAQNDANLLFAAGRIAYDERYERSGSVTLGGRGRVGDDAAIGVNVGADFYRSDLSSRGQTAFSFGLEGFTSVFDAHLNYRLPTTDRRTIGYVDPDLDQNGTLAVENNRLVERRIGSRLEEVPLHGMNGEIGARVPLRDGLSVRVGAGAFDYRDRWADDSFHGYHGSIELDVEDPLGPGSRFRLGAQIEDDNRFGTQASATVRLTIPLGSGGSAGRASRDRLDRQMGDRVRRDYVTAVGTRATDLSRSSAAIDARTGAAFGGVYYASGSAGGAGAGTSDDPTTLNDAVTRAGANGVVVAMGEGGPISTGGVTLAIDQYLVGGAGSVAVRRADGAVTRFGFGATNGTIVGTDATGAAVTLGQGSVIRDVTVSGSGTGVAANGVGGFALEGVAIQNTGGVGLALRDTLGPVTLANLTIGGGAGAGLLVRGGSSVTVRDSAISGGAGAIDIDDGGAALTVALSNLTLSATGGTVLDIDGSGAGSVTVSQLAGLTINGGAGETGGFAARGVRFDSDPNAAGVQAVNAGAMRVGTVAARVNGSGVSLSDVAGALNFAALDIANGGGTGVQVRNSKTNDFTLTTGTGTTDTVGGTALDLDPLRIDLRFTSVSSSGATGAGIVLDAVEGAGAGGNLLTIGTLNVTNAGGQGMLVTGGSSGSVNIGGGAISGSGGPAVQIGEQGVVGSGGVVNIGFGATISGGGSGPLVLISNSGGNVTLSGAITGTGPIVVEGTGSGSSTVFSGPVALTGAGGVALSLDNLLGSVSFSGPLTIANPAATAIRIGTVGGGATFGNVVITGLGSGSGLDLSGTQGNVSFASLQLTGTGVAGSTGINLSGTTNSGAIVIGGPSTIRGVDIGVDLSNAAATGAFQFGDSNAGNGLGSRIEANTVIVIAGIDASKGSYDFTDAELIGDTTNLSGGSFTTYYVLAGASGTGMDSSNPGTLAGALASGAQYIVLLNNPDGGQDVIDTIAAGGAFGLASSQTLVGFRDSDFYSVTGANTPANLRVTGVSPGGITNPFAGSGAALLTSSGSGATITLGNGSRVDGVVVGNSGGGTGIVGAGISGATIVNSTVSGSDGAISVRDGGATAALTLGNLDLAASAGPVLALSGSGGGSLAVSASGVTITGSGSAAGLALDSVTSGGIAINSITTGTAASTAVSLDGVTGGAVSLGAVAIGGTGSGAGVQITNSSAAVNTGTLAITGAAGDAIALSGNRGAITLGTVTLAGAGGAGIRATNMLGDVTVAGGSISGATTGLAVDSIAAGSTMTVGGLSLTGNGAGATIANVAGSLAFRGPVTISDAGLMLGSGNVGSVTFGALDIERPGAAGITFSSGGTGTTRFGNVTIDGVGTGATGVDARGAGGTIAFETLSIAGTSTSGSRGIDLTGATFSGTMAIAEGGTISGVGTGIDLTNAAITGSFRYGDGSNADADGAASSISAITPLAIAGLNGGTGSYDFSDVNLIGDTSALAGSASLFWVRAGANGAGTRADPGSLASAALAGTDIIVLLNDLSGGSDLLDANDLLLGTGGTFTLAAGQQLLGFLNGDTLAVPGGAPANVQLYNVASGVITNPFAGSGAPTLTTTALGGAATLVLSGNNLVDGVSIANGGSGVGIYGSGAANLVIRNSIVSGANGAINLVSGGGAASAALAGLTLRASGGTPLFLDAAGGGSLALTALSDIRIDGGNGEAGGARFSGVVFDSDLAAAGYQTVNAGLQLGGTGARLSGTALEIDGATGSLTLSSLAIRNEGGAGLRLSAPTLDLATAAGSIDTLNGTAVDIVAGRVDLSLGSIVHSGTGSAILANDATGFGAGGRAMNIDTLTASGGTSGIAVTGASSGSFVFGDGSSISGTTGSAIRLTGGVDLSFGGSVSQASSAALLDIVGHSGTVSFGSASALSATGGSGLAFSDADGSYAFAGTTDLSGGARIAITGGSAGSFTFASGSIVDANTAAFAVQNSTANVTFAGTIAQGSANAAFDVTGHSGGTLDFSGATIGATAGTGLAFSDADGTYRFGTATLSGGARIAITGGSSGAFTFASGSIVDANTAAFAVQNSTANVTFAGTVAQGSANAAFDVTGHSGGTLDFSAATIGATAGTGLAFSDADGTYRFGATTLSGGARIAITGGSAGSFTFASGSIVDANTAAFAVQNSTANVTFAGTIAQGSANATFDVTSHSGGTLDFSGATIGATAGTGLAFSDADGTYRFGATTLSGGARIAVTNGSAGSFVFGDVDVTGLTTNTTAVDLTGLTGSIRLETLDVTAASATGTRGIDLTGNTTGGDVIVAQGGTISGVGTGVDLTNAAITGNFRYGDGSNVDADGAASTISAVTPLVLAGLNGGVGTYDFADVNLVGDTTSLSVTAYFVREGATGTGASSDPGSLAGAMASSAIYIVLLNDPTGGTDVLDLTGAGGSLILDGGQTLYSFRDTDSFNVGGGAPGNVTLYNVQTGVITNPFAGSGAPLLTTSGTSPTITLGGANTLDGLVIGNSGLGAGIAGIGIGGATTIRNSTIAGGAAAAIDVQDGTATTILALNNLNLSAVGGNILQLDGSGTGSLTVSAFANLTASHSGETGGFSINDVVFDADPTVAPGLQPVSAGTLALGTSAARIAGAGLSLTNVTGTLNFGALGIANSGGTGLLVANSKANNFLLGSTGGTIDTLSGTAIDLDPLAVALTLDSVTASGGAYGILLDQVEGSFAVTGAVNVTNATTAGIAVRNNTGQATPLDVTLGGLVSIGNTSGAGIVLVNNSGASVRFGGGLDVTTTSGAGLSASGGGTLVIAPPAAGTNRITSGSGSALTLNGITVGADGISLDGVTTTSASNRAVTAQTLSLSGALSIGGLVASGGGGGALFRDLSGAGAVTLGGTMDIDGGIGLAFSGAIGTVNVANAAGSTLTIDGASVALDFSGVTGGTATIGGSGGSAAIGGATTASVRVAGTTGGTLNYLGSAVTSTSPLLSVSNSGGTINLAGALTSTSAGTAFAFANADGGYTMSGTVSHSGGSAVNVDAASAGTITFSGASKQFTTGASPAITMEGSGTLAFTGGGLDIDTANAVGFAATGGTVRVTGANNTIGTNGINGVALNFNGTTIGTGGLNFSEIRVANANTGIALFSVSGAAISLGTVDLQGIGARGIDIEVSLAAALDITDLDIALASGSATAFDLNGAALGAAITAGDFDVTNVASPGTSIAVDLRGATGGQTVRLGAATAAGASASIAGVNTGIFLDAASNAVFTFGDGEAATDGGSTISALTPIDASAAPAAGSYDFRDVSFSASPGRGFGIGRTVFIDSNGATGGGNGSGADGANPMTLAAAELAQQAGDTFFLINDGNAISAAGSNGNDTFTLLDGSRIYGFGNGAVTLTFTVPSTITLASTSLVIADPGSGAATLTTAASRNAITLGSSGNTLSGFVLDGGSAAAAGVVTAAGGTSNAVIRNLTVRDFTGFGVDLGTSANTLIEGLVFSGGGDKMRLTSATNATVRNVTVGGTGMGIRFASSLGTTTLENVSITGGTTGLSFVSAGGTVSATNVDLTGGSTAALAIDGGTASFSFDATSSITQVSNGAALSLLGNHTSGTFGYSGVINASAGNGLQFSNADGTYDFLGTTTLNGGDAGIDIYGGSGGSFTFGAPTSINGPSGHGVYLLNSDATLTYSGSITNTGGNAVLIDNHDAGTVTFQTGTISSTADNSGITVTNSNGGSVQFLGGTTLSTQTGTALNLTNNAGGTILFNAGASGLNLTTTSGTALNITGGGTVNVLGSNNSLATGSGTLIAVSNSGADNINLDLQFASGNASAATRGIDVSRSSTGTVTGSIAVAGGAITATGRGVSLVGDALGVTYGGTITTSGGAANSVYASGRTGGDVFLMGNVTDNGLGISLTNNSGGAINFRGANVTLNTGANAAITLANNSGATSFATDLAITTTSGAGILASSGGTLSISGANNSIQTVSGRILDISGLVAGTDEITFATLGSSGTVAGNAIGLSNLDGSRFTVTGATTIAGTTGASADGIFIGGNSAATIGFGATTIANTGGDGIEINGAGNGAVTFASTTIDNSAGHGVTIVGATNSVSINGGSIGGTNDPTLNGVNISGGTGAITIAAAIAKTSGGWLVQSDGHGTGAVTFSGNLSRTPGTGGGGINVQNSTSGTITFSGASKAINTGSQNNAVLLSSNTGATIAFTNGGLDIDTTSSAAFRATGGGTVTVQGSGNSITSGTGVALEIANTTIGAAGLTFQSIASNGATSGIVLNNTGSAGGLTVTGSGAAGSGGTIQNSTGDGISLTSTEAVRLAYMSLTANAGDGIGGSNVNGLLVDRMTITNNGTSAALDHSGINIANLSGGASGGSRATGILNSTISGNYEFEVQIANSSGTLTNFQVSNSTISAASVTNTPHGNLFNFLGSGTAVMGLTVAGTDFTGNWNAASPPSVITGTGLNIDTSGVSTTALVSGSTFTNNNVGIGVATGPGSAALTYSIDNNSFTGQRSHAISDFQNGNGPFTRTVSGRITNNVIGAAGVANSGSSVGNGISLTNEAAVNANYLISGNTIRYVAGAPAISANVGLGGAVTAGGTTSLTILNNVISNIGSRAIEIQDNQAGGGPSPTIRVNMSGNSFASIVGQAGNGQYLRFRVRDGRIELTQALATNGANAGEIDDANGFNDPSLINSSVGGIGTITGGNPAPTPPATVPALP